MITDGGHAVRTAVQREDFVRIVLAGLLGRELLIALAPQNDNCVIVTVQCPRTGRYIAELDELPVARIFVAKTQVIANRRRHIQASALI